MTDAGPPTPTPSSSTALPAHPLPSSSSLERTISQQSGYSTQSARSTRSRRSQGGTFRRKRLGSKQPSLLTSGGEDTEGDDREEEKGLTSFPTFSPEGTPAAGSSGDGRLREGMGRGRDVGRLPINYVDNDEGHLLSPSASERSNVSMLLARQRSTKGASSSTTTASTAQSSLLSHHRPSLFEDDSFSSPTNPRSSSSRVPGVLQHADDEHIKRLISRSGGAIKLVRSMGEDLARKDAQIVALKRKADERERALRKVVLDLGVSSLELEGKLRAVEEERGEARKKRREEGGGGVNGVEGMLGEALSEDVGEGFGAVNSANYSTGTVRARDASESSKTASKGTTKGWKEYIWGTGTAKKVAKDDGRPSILDNVFQEPEEADLSHTPSRASSIRSTDTRKSSLASRALKLVAGGGAVASENTHRGRASTTATAHGSLRSPSATSSTQDQAVGIASATNRPGALATIRRTATAHNIPVPPSNSLTKVKSEDRWDLNSAHSGSEMVARQESYGPVEMDSILPPDTQPPTLSRYNNYNNSEYLTDPFGFIYDQRRKKRQREAQQVARHLKRGSRTETLASGRSAHMSPILHDDSNSAHLSIGSDGRPASPTMSLDDGKEENNISSGAKKRWTDFLKIATSTTELLSHTPSMSAPSIQITEGIDLQPKSPGITTEDRGFVPTATTTTSAITEEAVVTSDADTTTTTSQTAAADDTEPVKILLQQLTEVHDSLQRDKTIRWNEFLRKVRAERKRESEAANAASAAAAEARFQKATTSTPESRITDGELIGVANWANKGKTGRAKWNEFNRLVLGGIPVAMRAKIWAECSGANSIRVPGYYDDLVAQAASETGDTEVAQQIRADINRTLTDNIFFRHGPGVKKLFEVLTAYSVRNPLVGYCQGMNLIAANLLLITPTAEDAFWILVCIIERLLPAGYYDHSLLASRADQVVLRRYVGDVLPKLSNHLEDLGVVLETMTFQWFLSVFTDCLSAEALFRVWDVVLCSYSVGAGDGTSTSTSTPATTSATNGAPSATPSSDKGEGGGSGSTFLFQVALALLKLNESQLLGCTTQAEVYTYINHQMTNHAISIDGLVQAGEALRRVVKREDVESRREEAVRAEKELVREREERRKR